MIVSGGNSSIAVLDLAAALTRQGLICITCLRLDAAFYQATDGLTILA